MRTLALIAVAAVLAGCAQVFEGNLLKNVDPPPPLSTSAMSKASVSDIQNQIADSNTATAFYAQLQNNPAALSALQQNLNGKISAASSSADKIDIAQTLILVTVNGAGAADVVNNAISQVSKLNSSSTSNLSSAVTSLMANKSQAAISALLTQFQTMQTAYNTMQGQAVNGSNEVDSTAFFGTNNLIKGDLAQTGLVTAAADAMVKDWLATVATPANTIDTLAKAIHDGTYVAPSTTTNIDYVSAAIGSPQQVTNPYAYLSVITGLIPTS